MPEQSYSKTTLRGLTPRDSWALFSASQSVDLWAAFRASQGVERQCTSFPVWSASTIVYRKTDPLRTNFRHYCNRHSERLLEKLTYYGSQCRYCHTPLMRGINLTWDHAIPTSRGGTHMLSNLLPCCRHCNSVKGSKTFFEFLRLA